MEEYNKIKKILALGFMHFLDENRPEGKMCLSNGECAEIEKAFNEQDWQKLTKYLDKYIESEDERMIKSMTRLAKAFYDCNFPTPEGFERKDLLAWLKSLLERFNLQPKQEWSEDIIQKAIKEVGLTQHQIDWFKTNVFPPKQEWSEEDKEKLGNLHRLIVLCREEKRFIRESEYDKLEEFIKSLLPQPKEEGCDYITPNKEFFQWIYDRLVYVHKENPNVDYMRAFKNRIDNSVFDQYHWKPSEEQMDSLRDTIVQTKGYSYSMYLPELYEQLKKLM